MEINLDDYFTARQAAEELGVTSRWITDQAKEGKIEAVFWDAGKRWMILKSAIEAMKHEREATQ